MLHTNHGYKAVMMLLSTLMMLSCKKENLLTVTTKDETAQKARLVKESLLTSIEKRLESQSQTITYTQLEVSYDSGRMSGMVNFAFGDGSVRSIRRYEYDAIGRLKTVAIKDEGTMTYVYDDKGGIKFGKFVHLTTPSKNYYLQYSRNIQAPSFTEDRFDAYNTHVERVVYRFNPDETYRSVEKFDPQKEMKLKGKVIMENSYEPKQLAAWKETVSKFPEPVLPMPVITMLSTKIEMFADSGYCCDDVIVDGRIITAQSVDLNAFGQTVRIRIATTNNRGLLRAGARPMESLSMNYAKAEW